MHGLVKESHGGKLSLSSPRSQNKSMGRSKAVVEGTKLMNKQTKLNLLTFERQICAQTDISKQ